MSTAADRHVPVLLGPVVDLLAPALAAPGSVLVDATLGMGGHSEGVLLRCPQARVVGVDRDPQALAMARERLAGFGERFLGVHAVYDELADVRRALGLGPVQGVLLDLGVSSWQLDHAERGFAYRHDAPLDMRMDQTHGITAAQVLNSYTAADLRRILRDYGEERFAGRVAAAIVRERERAPFTSSARLVELLRHVVPAASQRSGGHPAKRTFQALRIEVNAELEALATALPAALDSLAPGGRIVVLSYHSLEDRLVKQTLAARARSSAPPGLPVELPEHAPTVRLLTRHAVEPDPHEVADNPRSASARLRAAERLPTPQQGARR
ncbi:MAG TPA: 16S rRNA (cytosine(1402)-N(4))-methyltransferase RsmH [Dermatophilaceae bacterium]|nr:16S rRNA (cytosine(1402)-N(4))-methyltransferase RsmH [Dermatophilaceae bacterium]